MSPLAHIIEIAVVAAALAGVAVYFAGMVVGNYLTRVLRPPADSVDQADARKVDGR
ncbi:hypothetical protein [Nocardia sp. SC052]|uniref:hypothetical protein n=1 Tax=Nocardia sichangensis TaxID=3385975 RepID=UPI00399FEB2C